jgi:hypothetical protein
VIHSESDFAPACTQCTRHFPKAAVICSKCGHARPSFVCGTCHMLTPKHTEHCTFRLTGGLVVNVKSGAEHRRESLGRRQVRSDKPSVCALEVKPAPRAGEGLEHEENEGSVKPNKGKPSRYKQLDKVQQLVERLNMTT